MAINSEIDPPVTCGAPTFELPVKIIPRGMEFTEMNEKWFCQGCLDRICDAIMVLGGAGLV